MSMTLRHLLHCWCTSSSAASTCNNNPCESYEVMQQHQVQHESGQPLLELDESETSCKKTKKDIQFMGSSGNEIKDNILVQVESNAKQKISTNIAHRQKSLQEFSSKPKVQPLNRRPLFRGNSTQETLSKDEARKRMLSWRKTTKLRKTSDLFGSQKNKETRQVTRSVSTLDKPTKVV